VTKKQRLLNEREIESSMDGIEARLRSIATSGKERQECRRELRESLRDLVKRRFQGAVSSADVLLSDSSFEVTASFLDEARSFNPALGLEDLFQALRNVWIMTSLQLFRDEPIAYTPSIFAYSMLYPYTDNALDDRSIEPAEKIRSGERLRDRLSGVDLLPSSSHEADVFRLVGMIEGEHPRDVCPDVYESLLAIARAQMKSLRQQRRSLSPYETDLLALSLEKGGTSVLADAYLVAADLSAEEEAFHFGFGCCTATARRRAGHSGGPQGGPPDSVLADGRPLAAGCAHESSLPLPGSNPCHGPLLLAAGAGGGSRSDPAKLYVLDHAGCRGESELGLEDLLPSARGGFSLAILLSSRFAAEARQASSSARQEAADGRRNGRAS